MKKTFKKLLFLAISSLIITNIFAQTVQVTGPRGNEMMCGAFMGATGKIVGGTAPYSTNIQGVMINGSSIDMIPAGTSNIIITDANGVAATTNVSSDMARLQQSCVPAMCEFSALNKTDVTSFGGSNGSIQPSITWRFPGCGSRPQGGGEQFTVTPSGGGASTTKFIGQAVTGLIAGSYMVKLISPCTDRNSPNSNAYVTILQPSSTPLSFTKVVTQPPNCFTKGSITITASGGTPPYLYTLDNYGPMYNGYGSATATNLNAGPYSASIKDQANQTVSLGFQINNVSNISIATTYTNAICNSNNGTATVLATGGTAPYSYNWHITPNQNATTAIGLARGNYYVTVTDANGCVANSASISISKTTNPLQVTIKKLPGKNLKNTIEVFVNNIQASANNYTFLWSTNATTSSINLGYKLDNLAPVRLEGQLNCVGCPPPPTPTPQTTATVQTPAPTTTYTVTVKDMNGCSGTATYIY